MSRHPHNHPLFPNRCRIRTNVRHPRQRWNHIGYGYWQESWSFFHPFGVLLDTPAIALERLWEGVEGLVEREGGDAGVVGEVGIGNTFHRTTPKPKRLDLQNQNPPNVTAPLHKHQLQKTSRRPNHPNDRLLLHQRNNQRKKHFLVI